MRQKFMDSYPLNRWATRTPMHRASRKTGDGTGPRGRKVGSHGLFLTANHIRDVRQSQPYPAVSHLEGGILLEVLGTMDKSMTVNKVAILHFDGAAIEDIAVRAGCPRDHPYPPYYSSPGWPLCTRLQRRPTHRSV